MPRRKRAGARRFNIAGRCFSVHTMSRHEDEIFALLCGALGRRGPPASFALASELNSDTFAAMIGLAETERVLPALYDALADRHGAQVAKPMRAVCAVHEEANRRRNAAIRAALLELGKAAAAEGFAFAALKGAAWVIEDGDSAAAWRSMLDMDVLVDAKRFDDIPSFLDRLGYVRLTNDARYDVNFHHAPYARSDGVAMVEVHRHLGSRHRLLAPDRRAPQMGRQAGFAVVPSCSNRLRRSHVAQDGIVTLTFVRQPDVRDDFAAHITLRFERTCPAARH